MAFIKSLGCVGSNRKKILLKAKMLKAVRLFLWDIFYSIIWLLCMLSVVVRMLFHILVFLTRFCTSGECLFGGGIIVCIPV